MMNTKERVKVIYEMVRGITQDGQAADEDVRDAEALLDNDIFDRHLTNAEDVA